MNESIDRIVGTGDAWLAWGRGWLEAHALSALLALTTLLVGLWIIARLRSLADRAMERRQVEPTLGRFLLNVIGIGLKLLLFVSVLGMVGIGTAPFIAVLGAAGLAVGLALQGSLANFAGGVLVLMFRPFRVGQVIDAQGSLGTVHDIGILYTTLKTFDNRTIIIPNGALSNDRITNFSLEDRRRADWVFGVSYDDDVREVKALLERLLSEDSRILTEPEPVVVISAFADSSVNFTVRAWVAAADLFPVIWDMNERVKLAFDEADITIPYPQRDVHVHGLPRYSATGTTANPAGG